MRVRVRRFQLGLHGIAITTVIAMGGTAQAQEKDEAEQTFERGLAAMMKHDYASGCPLLAVSYRADPRLGTLFTLAECEGQSGKPGRALFHYQAFLREYKKANVTHTTANDERSRIAETRRTELARRVAFVTIVVPAPRPVGTTVRIGEDLIDPALLGTELPIEPGDNVVRLDVPDRDRQEVRVSLALGDHRTVLLALPDRAAPAPTAAIAPAPAPSPSSSSPPPAREPGSGVSPWPIVTGSIAVGALALGTVGGLVVVSKKSDIDAACPQDACTSRGLDDVETARTFGTVSTISFVVAVTAIAATAAIVLLAPSRTTAAARRRLDPPLFVLPLRGTW
jgi:hypothetical protein